MTRQAIWKSMVAGLCGSIAHSLLMLFKQQSGILPAFQPYDSLQAVLAEVTGRNVPAFVPWVLSFLNGSTLVGFAFGYAYPVLPGGSGAVKGLIFGLLGWIAMGVLFFPLIGLGVFASGTDLGAAPALFSLAMLLAYSVVLGVVYAALAAR
jgi:hypothetical protein